MNKKMLLLATMAIGAQSVLPLTASAADIYSDIKNVIIEDALTGKTDQEKYDNTVEVLERLYQDRESLKNRIVSIHTGDNVEAEEMAPVFAGLSAILFTGAGYACYIKSIDAIPLGIFGTLALGGAGLAYFNNARHIARNKSRIAEINEVIIKLEAMKTELAGKLGIVEIQQA